MATIRKAQRIDGATLSLYNASVAHAAFIHALRTDGVRARHLSPISPDVGDQVRWLQRYAGAADQAYFVIARRQHAADLLGTVRLYGARGAAFSWGSWLLRPGLPAHCGIESALMVYHYARWLGFTSAYFEVRQQNTSVCRFHQRFGARRVGAECGHYQYHLSDAAMQAGMARYRRYLPQGIQVAATD